MASKYFCITIKINDSDIPDSYDNESYASRTNETAWFVNIAKSQTEKYGLLPIVTHELGHVVSCIVRDPVAEKDIRLIGGFLNKGTIISGTNIYRSEERAWEIAEMIAFKRAKTLTLRTYNYMVGKLVNMLYAVLGEEKGLTGI
jgi:hypothetical protein